jgi:hypothetical protein
VSTKEQKGFNRLFKKLATNELSREGYVEACNKHYQSLDPQAPATKALKRRINSHSNGVPRTCGEFALALVDNVRREKAIVRSWIKAARLRGRVADTGMDNTGCVALDPDLVNSDADFRIGKQLWEIKTNRFGLAKCTLKVASLESYISQGAKVLIVWEEGGAEAWYAVLDAAIMRKMLDTLPRRKYRETGGVSDCVQLLRGDYEKYFSVHPFVIDWNLADL